jgi:DNA polymerase-3 subunit delta'
MSFSAIKGQDKAIEIIKSYARKSRFIGGYLFTGPQGVGKRMAAISVAKALNCLSLKGEGCNSCSSCLKIEKAQHPDVHLICADGEQIKIDSVRALQKEMGLRAYEGECKVFIIDNAHNLTAEASNCLLKVLEEPSGNSLIILITDKPGLLFKTIVSRCKIIKFSSIRREEMEDVLIRDYKLERSYSHFLAYFSEGRLGRALRLKEGDVFSKKNTIIDKFILSSRPSIDAIVSKDRVEVRETLNLLASWFRDIYLIKAGLREDELINLDRKPELLKYSGKFSFSDLDRILNDISNAIYGLDQNINTRLLLYNLGIDLWKA